MNLWKEYVGVDLYTLPETNRASEKWMKLDGGLLLVSGSVINSLKYKKGPPRYKVVITPANPIGPMVVNGYN